MRLPVLVLFLCCAASSAGPVREHPSRNRAEATKEPRGRRLPGLASSLLPDALIPDLPGAPPESLASWAGLQLNEMTGDASILSILDGLAGFARSLLVGTPGFLLFSAPPKFGTDVGLYPGSSPAFRARIQTYY